MKKILLTLSISGILLTGSTTVATASDISSPELPGGSLRVIDTETQEGLELPLKHTDVNATISGFVAEVEVRQEYINPFETPIEAIYIFPLPHNAAVYDVEMRIGERVINADIKRREEAREIYEEAKKRGQRASLLEQERPNIFTQSVANILPGDEITIVIRYTETLNFEEDTYEFVFPTVVGPRYIPGDWIEGNFVPGVTDFDRINPPVLKPGQRSGHDISITVNVDTGGIPITDISTVTHDVDISQPTASTAQVSLQAHDTIPNKDLVLKYTLGSDKPQFAFFAYNPPGEDGYFSLMIQPQTQFEVSEVTPKEVFFIVDTSGSMSGAPIEMAKEAMAFALQNLNPEDSFYLMKFSNLTQRLSPEPLSSTPTNIMKGLQYIDDISAGGGTEMLPGIIEALEYPDDPGKLRIVTMMGDGFIGNENQILDAIQTRLGDQTRLFSFGIGSSTNRFLLDSMGRIGRGSTYYVTLRDDSETVISEFYDRIRSPLFTNLDIDWGSTQVKELYPDLIPDIFAGQPLYVFGRYEGSGADTITVSGLEATVDLSAVSDIQRAFGIGAQVDRNNKIFSIPAAYPVESTSQEWIGRLWARNKIKDLTDQMFKREVPEIVEEITDLGLRHRISTAYTSFVAVEEVPATTPGQTQTIVVPVELPEGTQYEGFFGTPSSEISFSNPLSAGPARSIPLGISTASGYGGSILDDLLGLILWAIIGIGVIALILSIVLTGIVALIAHRFHKRTPLGHASRLLIVLFTAIVALILLGITVLFAIALGEFDTELLFALIPIAISLIFFFVTGLLIHKFRNSQTTTGTSMKSFGLILISLLFIAVSAVSSISAAVSSLVNPYVPVLILIGGVFLGIKHVYSWHKIVAVFAALILFHYGLQSLDVIRSIQSYPNIFLEAGLIFKIAALFPVGLTMAYAAGLIALLKRIRWSYVVLGTASSISLIQLLLSGITIVSSIGTPLLSIGVMIGIFLLRRMPLSAKSIQTSSLPN